MVTQQKAFTLTGNRWVGKTGKLNLRDPAGILFWQLWLVCREVKTNDYIILCWVIVHVALDCWLTVCPDDCWLVSRATWMLSWLCHMNCPCSTILALIGGNTRYFIYTVCVHKFVCVWCACVHDCVHVSVFLVCLYTYMCKCLCVSVCVCLCVCVCVHVFAASVYVCEWAIVHLFLCTTDDGGGGSWGHRLNVGWV